MLHIEPPLLEPLPLSVTAGRAVRRKMDALQPFNSVRVVVCGGATCTADQIRA